MTINGVFKPDNKRHEELLLLMSLPILQKELNEFVMTWNSRNVECQSEYQIISSGSRWCTWRNISFASYSGFPKLRNWCRKRWYWCSRWCFRSEFTRTIYRVIGELCSHSFVKLPQDPESGIEFYADVLIFLHNDGLLCKKNWQILWLWRLINRECIISLIFLAYFVSFIQKMPPIITFYGAFDHFLRTCEVAKFWSLKFYLYASDVI